MAPAVPPTPQIVHWLKRAGHLLLQAPPPGLSVGKSKDAQGNILTIMDKAVQCHIVNYLLDASYDFLIVGEEDVAEETNGACQSTFPEHIPPDKIVAIIDPTDGSKNWTVGKNFSITFALQKADDVIFAAVYFPLTHTTYVLDPYLGMTVDLETFSPTFKTYDQNDLSLCYGFGRVLTKAQEGEFLQLLNDLSPAPVDLSRPGCASASFFEVFTGKCDCYATTKERWTNIAPLYKFAKEMGFYISINLASLNKNEDFRMALATPEFAGKHLCAGTPLAILLNI